ncbi:P2Y purinoceptor 1 [Xenopus tropicalis]|uniref:P2Y purinoceptor 1 n=1 Tax=Xenopus tropicalis TaxID=8364 RepID=A0A803JD07_XENTR|nr:P2Y purinoceptor 1 [Xenopus tropicalis]|eukprot:XP_002933207.2 PREDICTED: P2Y purinoceptor 1-like [Xenopus tropicalis]
MENSTNSSSCTINKEFTFRYLSSVYLVVFLVGLFANIFGLRNLRTNRKKWTSLNVFMLNLGIADLLYVITLPFFVSYYLKGEVWLFGHGFCRLARCLFHVNMYSSISFLTCISVQRYLGIVHPMKMMGTFQNLRPSVYISVLMWIWVVIQVIPSFFISESDPNNAHCHDSTSNDNLKKLEYYTLYTMILTVTGFFIPFLINVVCYARVLSVLRRNKNIDPILKRKSIKLVAIALSLFFICFFPFYILRNFNLFSRLWQKSGTCSPSLKSAYIVYQVTRGLASMNSAINPMLYFVTNETFAMKFRRIRRSTLRAFVFLGRNRDINLTWNTELKMISESEA